MNRCKGINYVIGILLLFFSIHSSVFANSTHILPYPSFMPGSTQYKILEAHKYIMQYWHFGSFSKYIYHLKETDRKIVEAKTLFEYNQYPLAIAALEKSDTHFKKVFESMEKARKEKKDISQKKVQFAIITQKHREVLENLKKNVPSHYTWIAEQNQSINLDIFAKINSSINLRRKLSK